jgi:hypothetical protein
MDSQINDAAWLAWIEQLAIAPASRDGENELPRSLFHCRLDDQPDHLVPERLLRPECWEGLADRPLFLNPGCFFAANGESPPEIPTPVFGEHGPMSPGKTVWIRDPGSLALRPFWLGHELASALDGVHPGDPAPFALSRRARRTLLMAELLVPDNYVSARREQWDETVSVAGAHFRAHSYAPVGRLIHPFHVAALRRYYRQQLRTGKLRLGDSQTPLRYIAYNDPVSHFFHRQLTAAISAIVGEPLKASYMYLAAYQPGAILEKHTDREQCEFSLTLCLDYSPEPCHATPWPIHLHKRSGTVTVFQAIGDALLYRGCQLPHSRGMLPRGHTSTSIIFHYVREDFAGSLD